MYDLGVLRIQITIAPGAVLQIPLFIYSDPFQQILDPPKLQTKTELTK